MIVDTFDVVTCAVFVLLLLVQEVIHEERCDRLGRYDVV